MTLKKAIEEKNILEIRKITKITPIADIANILEELSIFEVVVFFSLLNTDLQSEIFSALELEYQEKLVKSFTNKQIKDIVGHLYVNEITDLVEEVSLPLAKRILSNTNKETRSLVNKILRYSDDQVGSIMHVDIVTLKQSSTISEARKYIRQNKNKIKFAHHFFVIDNKDNLIGHVDLEDLLLENPKKNIKKITKPISFVSTTTNREEAAIKFAEQDMSVLPVINSKKKVIGMISSEDVIDIIKDQATEDIQKMAGIESTTNVPYLKQKTFRIFNSRIIWLMLLMISATLSQIILDLFQNLSNRIFLGMWITTGIIAIMPVISGAAGNAGSQSSTTIIRSLAVGDIDNKDYFKIVFKEFKVSFLIGLTLGIVNFLRLIIYYSIRNHNLDAEHLLLSFAASLSLLIVIILAKIVGSTLPLFAKLLKIDPASMAAPLLTTLVDAISTIIFFGISLGIMWQIVH